MSAPSDNPAMSITVLSLHSVLRAGLAARAETSREDHPRCRYLCDNPRRSPLRPRDCGLPDDSSSGATVTRAEAGSHGM
jgi:hypothetical protein